MKSYILYTDHYDAAKATLYVEAGDVDVVPRAGERVTVNTVAYVVKAVLWDVYTDGTHGPYPQQCATVVLKKLARQ